MNLLNIPVNEETISRIMQYLFKPTKHIEELCSLILSYPSLVYKLISTANIEEFGFQKKITTVSTAISVLELDIVENLLLDNNIIHFSDKSIKIEYNKILNALTYNINIIKEDTDYNTTVINFIASGYLFLLNKYQKNYFSLTINNKLKIFLKNIEDHNLNEKLLNDIKNKFCKFL